jgi:pilus assembly protein Flp/PilA
VHIISLFPTFFRDDTGVTAVEYGLIAALVAVSVVIAVTAIGTSLSAIFATLAAAI